MARPRALGASVFAGGFTQGVKKHFDVLHVLEETSYGVETARANHPEIPVTVGRPNWEAILDEYAPATPADALDLIYGNPPCAAWSSAGYTPGKGRDKWRTDDRINCTLRHFELLEKLRPRVWVTESVQSAFTAGREFFDQLCLRANALGYDSTYLLHNAKWFGVPQNRKRLFFLCHRVPLRFEALNWAPPTAAEEALTELEEPGEVPGRYEESLARLLPHVLPGEKLQQTWERLNPGPWVLNERGQVPGRPSVMKNRLKLNEPAYTFTGHAAVHPIETRFLSIEECAAICGFPPEYWWPKKSSSYRLIARGVCPPVGEWLARNVAASLS